ncbi:MAG: hypothetical protein QW555_03530 [Nitrososphaerota archaeon]
MKGSAFVVVWEGTDGSGKTTLMKRVEHILKRRGFSVITHKTPGSSPSGKLAVSYGNRPNTSPLTRMLLFLANTVDESSKMARKIDQKTPHFLFIDRYHLCSLVYGLALLKHRRGLQDLPSINEMLRLVENMGRHDYLPPDLYVIIDVGEEERLKRLRGKRGKEKVLETDTAFQNIVREIYDQFAAANPHMVYKALNEANRLEELSQTLAEKLIELRSKTTH